ncbi:hypothetical protein A21D_00718 [Virgibacillus dokdonensis]|uniref:Uncharacterized protein n=1 Tax=Virgibacillus dokdonensis TaxID=302167 RepID=A0A2K9J4B4_9BACI|nr:hypothetical protein A21D_00718 [Virgibacillus dokdonensis]
MQNALKDIFGPMFESMLKGEMNKKRMIKKKKTQRTGEMDMGRKPLRQAPVK